MLSALYCTTFHCILNLVRTRAHGRSMSIEFLVNILLLNPRTSPTAPRLNRFITVFSNLFSRPAILTILIVYVTFRTRPAVFVCIINWSTFVITSHMLCPTICLHLCDIDFFCMLHLFWRHRQVQYMRIAFLVTLELDVIVQVTTRYGSEWEAHAWPSWDDAVFGLTHLAEDFKHSIFYYYWLLNSILCNLLFLMLPLRLLSVLLRSAHAHDLLPWFLP